MTPEQLAALVAENRKAAAAIGKHPGVIAKIIVKRHTATADAIEHLQAEVARLSTPPDDAEVAALVKVYRSCAKSLEHEPGFVLKELRRHHEATADALTRLSHAHASETAKREAMEEALRTVDAQLQGLGYQADGAMRHGVRAALAKHGSK